MVNVKYDIEDQDKKTNDVENLPIFVDLQNEEDVDANRKKSRNNKQKHTNVDQLFSPVNYFNLCKIFFKFRKN